MRDTTLKVALAGLMHDIGKFAQGCLLVSREYLDNNAGLYQPFREHHHTHVHAVYTAAFIEQMKDRLPPVCNRPGWGEGDSFVNLAAGHHKPETPMQWIVATADRISSGLDRATFEAGESIAYQDFRKTRLLPVLESMGPKRCSSYDRAEAYQYAYPLAPLSAQTIFPEERRPKEKDAAEEEYRRLFETFCERLGRLPHRTADAAIWAQHFDSLLLAHTAMIPAARVGDVVHDVSLYDHCRSTAALAAALYRYHVGTGTMNEAAITSGAEEKFILVGGDFYGIQEFIFSARGESRRFRSKLLRGRSFAVSLFSELAAMLLCQRLELPFLSVLLNAAGKFHLLAPNLPETREEVSRCEQEINDWLFAHTFGESSLGISLTTAAPDDFHAGRFRRLWIQHLENIEARKYHKVDLDRHGGAVEGYLDSFNNDIEPGKRLCPLCGKRASRPETLGDKTFKPDDGTVSCLFCRDHVYLGANLVRGKMVAVCDAQAALKPEQRLLAPIFGTFQVCFTGNSMDEEARAGRLLALWQTSAEPDGSLDHRATVKLMNGHVPCYRPEDGHDACLLESARVEGKTLEMIDQIREGTIKTFHHLAVKARRFDADTDKCRGIEALGVLKADVDNLGMLFGCGLADERFTVSRLATASRQLNSFFALYLPHLLASSDTFRDTYTVFAGGDDLFLVGSWNRMADLALHVRERFADFVCHNQEITLSAGITVHKPNTPVNVMAEAAESALEAAKHAGRNRVTMFGYAVDWEAFAELLAQRREMEGWLARKYISDVMFYRFNHLVAMAEQEQRLGETSVITLEEMACVKWPAMFRYSLARNVSRTVDDREAVMDEIGRAAAWIDKYRGAMRIPLWHVLYEKRA